MWWGPQFGVRFGVGHVAINVPALHRCRPAAYGAAGLETLGCEEFLRE